MQIEKIEANAPATEYRASHRGKPMLIAGAAVLIFLLLIAGGSIYYFGKREISASGGLYFLSRLELNVPRFAQADPRWADDLLGRTDSTMGGEGCAVSSAAMVLAYYGVNIDPGGLNTFLTNNGGFTSPRARLWGKATPFSSPKAKTNYKEAPPYSLHH